MSDHRLHWVTLPFAVVGVVIAALGENWSAMCWAAVAALGMLDAILQRRGERD